MALRTFYWNPLDDRPAKTPFWKFGRSPRGFEHGNAGDRFNLDLLEWAYPGQQVTNVKDAGQRLLLVGSVAHRALDGDLVCGIGSKHADVPAPGKARVQVLGVRGPMTLDAFRQAGHDISRLRFMGDPGFLIGKLYPATMDIVAERGRTIFIPHYRERFQYPSTRSYAVVSIDATPRMIAEEIGRAEFVYTSSLHGLVWAHALGRPARLVSPQTEESLHKYQDYFLSIGQPFESAASIDEALRGPKPTSPIDVSSHVDGIVLPTLQELKTAGVVS